MSTDPPDLDDTRYEALVERARQLIPRYCPEWTNLNDADPGMTLVQLFAWMTELSIFRLNQVPHLAHQHLLRLLGVEPEGPRPARTILAFRRLSDRGPLPRVERGAECSTEQGPDGQRRTFVLAEGVDVHLAVLHKVVALDVCARTDGPPDVRIAERWVMEEAGDEGMTALRDRQGAPRALRPFGLDPEGAALGARPAEQVLVLEHPGLQVLALDGGTRIDVRPRVGSAETAAAWAAFFQWEVATTAGWVACDVLGEGGARGVPGSPTGDRTLALGGAGGVGKGAVRGLLRFDAEYLRRFRSEGAARVLPRRGEGWNLEWTVRAVEGEGFEVGWDDGGPLGPGDAWVLRLPRVSPSVLPAWMPKLQWSYASTDGGFRTIPPDRIHTRGLELHMPGPSPPDLALPPRLRARRTQAVDLGALCDEGDLRVAIERPVSFQCWKGSDVLHIEPCPVESPPWEPWSQMEYQQPVREGAAIYLASDVFDGQQERVDLEVRYLFRGHRYPTRGEWGVEDDLRSYTLRLEVRTKSGFTPAAFRTEDGRTFTEFSFADFRPLFSESDAHFIVRIPVEPRRMWGPQAPIEWAGADRHVVRLVVRSTDLVRTEEAQTAAQAVGQDGEAAVVRLALPKERVIIPLIFGVAVCASGDAAARMGGPATFLQPVRGARWRRVDLDRDDAAFDAVQWLEPGSDAGLSRPGLAPLELERPGQWLYFGFTGGLDAGRSVSMHLRSGDGVGRGVRMEWQALAGGRWRGVEGDGAETPFDGPALIRLNLPLPSDAGKNDLRWIRARLRPGSPAVERLELAHVLVHVAEAVNLERRPAARFSATGAADFCADLGTGPVLVLHRRGAAGEPPSWEPRSLAETIPQGLRDMSWIGVETDDLGGAAEWEPATAESWPTVGRAARRFRVDAVAGRLRFGDGITGAVPPFGRQSLLVRHHYGTAGARGNLRPGSIGMGPSDVAVSVRQPFAAEGGRDLEALDALARRLPSTLRDGGPLVTADDFARAARAAHPQVHRARAVRDPTDPAWVVRIVVLWRSAAGDQAAPTPGAVEQVRRALQDRAPINVEVRIVEPRFVPIRVTLRCRAQRGVRAGTLRLRVEAWLRQWLDPVTGGTNGEGWPVGTLPCPEDLQQVLRDVPELRSVLDGRIEVPAGFTAEMAKGAVLGFLDGAPRVEVEDGP